MKPILILEDCTEDVLLLRHALDRAGVRNPLHVVSTVPYAMAYLSGTAPYEDRSQFPLPGMVMVDLMIPVMDGFAFLEWKRPLVAFDSVVTVVVSGVDDTHSGRRACELGTSAFLHKNTLQTDLQTLVQTFPQLLITSPKAEGSDPLRVLKRNIPN